MYWPAGQGEPEPFQTQAAGWVWGTFPILQWRWAAGRSTAFPLPSGFAAPSIVCMLISLTLPVPRAGKTTYASSTASFIILVNRSEPDTAEDSCFSCHQLNQQNEL